MLGDGSESLSGAVGRCAVDVDVSCLGGCVIFEWKSPRECKIWGDALLGFGSARREGPLFLSLPYFSAATIQIVTNSRTTTMF